MKPLHLSLLILAALLSCQPLNTGSSLLPSGREVINKGTDFEPVLNSGYQAWWQSVHGPATAVPLGVAGDAHTLPWDDFGASLMGQEPRMPYPNQSSAPNAVQDIARVPWYGCLSAVTEANEVLRASSSGISLDNGGPLDQSARAAARALRGLSWGYLSLLFDQAPVVTEDTPLDAPLSFSSYAVVNNRAVAELLEAADTAASLGEDFFHPYFNGLALDGTAFGQLCRAYAARFLAQASRTPEETGIADWEQVLSLAQGGLSEDFAPQANGQAWVSYHYYTLADTEAGPFWARLDQRLVAAFDPAQPARYPQVEALQEPPLQSSEAVSDDARLSSDFLYNAFVPFPAARGEWFFSHYRHQRQNASPGLFGDGRQGPMPVFLQADLQLLQAEAHARLGDRAAAATLLNNGPRISRGNLPPLSPNAPASELLQAIAYERMVELHNTAPFGTWLDRRRLALREPTDDALTPLGGLQYGTPAQLPVPAAELRVNGMPVYTFGGPDDPQGIERQY